MGWGHLQSHGSDSGNNADEGPSSSTPVPRQFPPAAQPEMMRAAEKDDQYASFVYEACRDAFRHLFGLSLSLCTKFSDSKSISIYSYVM
jgi:peroxin-10